MKEAETHYLAGLAAPEASDAVPALVGKIYAEASPAVRCTMLEHLLKPLGVLSLVAVANGVFSRIVLREGWPRVQVRTEDVQAIEPHDVVTLVQYVQQVSSQVFDGLFGIILNAPVLASSAAFALLMAVRPQPCAYWMQAPAQDGEPRP